MFLKHVMRTGLCAAALYAAAGTDTPPLEETQTMVVTATRMETPSTEVGSAVTVLTHEDLVRGGAVFVADALRMVPGLDLVANGGVGKVGSAFMRGTESNHTLWLLDGVQLADPINTGGQFDPANLTIDAVERIEIVRGPQSTLYGSEALGGVIHIITRGAESGTGGTAAAEAGSYGTQRLAAGIHTGTERLRIKADLAHFRNDGFSASDAGGTPEDDGYRNTTLSAGLAFHQSPSLVWSLNARAVDAEGDIDAGGGLGGDDPNYRSTTKQTFLRAGLRATLFDGTWNQEAYLAVTDHDRGLTDLVDPAHPDSSSDADYQGRQTALHWQNTFALGKHHTLLAGISYEEEEGESVYTSVSSYGPFTSIFAEERAENAALYAQDHIRVTDTLAVTLGARLDDHDGFGSQDTYRATGAWQLGAGLALKGSYGTAFKAPSLYQRFSAYGNTDLLPEENTGWDAGLEWGEAAMGPYAAARWFDNDITNLIDFDGLTSSYNNVSDVDTRGLELEGGYRAGGFHIRGAYTYTRAENRADGEDLFRRPRDKWHLSAGYSWSRIEATLIHRHVGPRDFNDYSTYPSSRTTLPAFDVTHLTGAVRLRDNLRLTVRAENLFDETYQEVLGYNTPGASGYLGLKLDY